MDSPIFQHDIGSRVRLTRSSELGVVIGRAEFATAENTYLIRYKAADGRQAEQWWGESALRAA